MYMQWLGMSSIILMIYSLILSWGHKIWMEVTWVGTVTWQHPVDWQVNPMIFIIFHWVFGGEEEIKEREKEEIMGNQAYFLSALVIPPYVDLQVVAVWSCSDAILYNLLIPFPILESEFCWVYCTLASIIFTLFRVQYLWWKCDILKKKISLSQPQLAAILLCCYLHHLLPIF